ncbi:MAG: hypothetical protein LBV39_05960 [Bacteroidales bacterium]|jgi:hypothetical protein|nr:hypothetical protein [Bacteroidales bacterium]
MIKFYLIRNEATYGYFGQVGFTSLLNATGYNSEEEALHTIEHKAELAHCYLSILPIYHV